MRRTRCGGLGAVFTQASLLKPSRWNRRGGGAGQCQSLVNAWSMNVPPMVVP